jgi:hypothetical protein
MPARTCGEGSNTVLGIKGFHFTLNDKAAFLLGFSYYGALGAREDFIRKDLTEFRGAGFNWLRVWATWGGYDTNVSAVTATGLPREPHLSRLKWLVGECDRIGLVVDVTLNRGKELPVEFQRIWLPKHPGYRTETVQELVSRPWQRTGCPRRPLRQSRGA